MTTTTRVQCRNCDERRNIDQTELVQRKVGGSYNRAPRWQPCRICRGCIASLVERIGQGSLSTNRWSNHGLRHALTRLEGNDQ